MVLNEPQPPKTPITSDVPLGLPHEEPSKEKLDFQKRIKEEQEEIEASEFYYLVCPTDEHLLRATEFDETGKITKCYCPQCRKETTKANAKKYSPHLECVSTSDDPSLKEQPIEPQTIANDIKANFLFITDRDTETLYRYDDEKHKWANDGDVYLKEILVWHLKNRNRKSVYDNIFHCLKSATFEDMEFSNKFVAAENGLLDVEHGVLTDFTPNAMPSYAIPVTFNKEAKCPKWLEFVNQVVSEDDKTLLQEFSGFLLLPDYRKHKVLWIHGEGRNGKGVWARTMEGVLGEENCSSVSLEQFDGTYRFAMERLRGKLFNVSSEPTTTKILQTPLLKRVTGQDRIDGEIKGRQKTVSFTNTAKLVVVGNKFPKIDDTTLAFKDRMMFIKFTNIFTGKAQIDDLEKKWLDNPEEKSGILNWMLEGLQRLLKNGVFTESKSQKETMLEFQRVSDSISAFLTEQCRLNSSKATARSVAYEQYKEYCDLIGTKPENDRAFTQRLKNTPRIKSGWTRVQGKVERAWVGFTVNPLQDEAATDATFATLPLHPRTFEESSNKVEESIEGVANVTSVAVTRQCSECNNFRQPSCERENWEFVPGTENASGYKCFKIKVETSELPEYSDDNPRGEES